jgi:type VI secretion system protein
MQITLTVEKCSDPAMVGSQVTFDEHGGTLGRSADNDWVLPDPKFYTSGRHARISCEGEEFAIEDLSTNGTFHNNPDRLIGKQRSARLTDGDLIYVGEFQIRVNIEQPELGPTINDGTDSSEADSLLMDPGTGGSHENDTERDEFDDLLEGCPPEQSDRGPVSDQHDTGPQFGADRFGDDDGGLDLDDDELVDKPASSSGEFQQSPEREFFAAPDSGKSSENEIPDEWDALLTGFFEPPAEAAPEQRSKSSPRRSETSPPVKPASSPPPPAPEPTRQSSKPPPRQKPAPAPRGPVGRGDVMVRILQELGIEDAADEIDPEDFAEQLGQVVRMVGEGLMQLLASRAEIKNEFRIDQTRIASTRNNPLKFSPTIEEALRRVFVERDVQGFISGAESFEQALNDLRAHQVAILAAVQGSIESVIRQFNPEQLESKLKKISPISASAPLIREAKCWNLFTSHYEEISSNLRDDAKKMFVREFAEAYERSSNEIERQIAASRGRDDGA